MSKRLGRSREERLHELAAWYREHAEDASNPRSGSRLIFAEHIEQQATRKSSRPAPQSRRQDSQPAQVVSLG